MFGQFPNERIDNEKFSGVSKTFTKSRFIDSDQKIVKF